MEFPYIVLATVLCACLLLHSAEAEVYQPECTSLDQAVQTLNAVSFSPFSATMTCSRNANCTGFSCSLEFEGQRAELNIKLHPCEDPPQMFLLIQDPDTSTTYIQETITHGDTYTIPGLKYNYQQFLIVDVAIAVQFEKVPEGLKIGFDLVLRIGDQNLPAVTLLPPTVIDTPPCTTQGPDSIQCVRMRELVQGLAPPDGFQCRMSDDCRGISCSGAFQVAQQSYPVTAYAILDSCTQPISYNITLWNGDGDDVLWSNSFTHSSDVEINTDLPDGLQVRMNVTMDPIADDIDYLRTTILLTVYYDGTKVKDDTFFLNDRVPIPPCEHPMSPSTPMPGVTMTPIPGGIDECMTFQAISADIMSNELFANDDVQCHPIGPISGACNGFTCNLTTNDHPFMYNFKLFHCETPVRVLFTADSRDDYNYHVTRNISHSDIVPLDRVDEGLSMKFVVVRRTVDAVELAISLLLDNGNVRVSLVEDRLVPVASCDKPTSGPTVAVSKPPKGTKPPKGPKPGPNGTGGGGGKDKLAGSGISNAAKIAVPLVIAAMVVIVVIVLVVWYRRRSRGPNDQIHLVENASPEM